jgi:hypothetical protein
VLRFRNVVAIEGEPNESGAKSAFLCVRKEGKENSPFATPKKDAGV